MLKYKLFFINILLIKRMSTDASDFKTFAEIPMTLDIIEKLRFDPEYSTIDITCKICDFCQVDLPVEHKSQKCILPDCSTIYDVCGECKEKGVNNDNICFKDHAKSNDDNLIDVKKEIYEQMCENKQKT